MTQVTPHQPDGRAAGYARGFDPRSSSGDCPAVLPGNPPGCTGAEPSGASCWSESGDSAQPLPWDDDDDEDEDVDAGSETAGDAVIRSFWSGEATLRGLVGDDEAEARRAVGRIAFVAGERLKRERHARRVLEDGELAVRDGVEAGRSTILKVILSAERLHRSLAACFAEQRHARLAVARAAAVEAASLDLSMRQAAGSIEQADAFKATAHRLLSEETTRRAAVRAEAAAARTHAASVERGAWLRARSAELARGRSPPDADAVVFAHQYFQYLRDRRLAQARGDACFAPESAGRPAGRTVSFVPEAAETPKSASELAEIADLLPSQEASCRQAIAAEETVGIHELSDAAHCSAFEGAEAIERRREQSVFWLLWRESLGLIIEKHAGLLAEERTAFLRALEADERRHWLESRRAEVSRIDRELAEKEEAQLLALEERLAELRRLEEAHLVYSRAEADDRSILLAKERRSWRDLCKLSNTSVKQAVMALVTQQVDAEVSHSTLVWNKELWQALEIDSSEQSNALQSEETAARDQLASLEIHSYLASRRLELDREKAEAATAVAADEVREAPVRVPEPPRDPLPDTGKARLALFGQPAADAEGMAELRAKWQREAERRAAQARDEGTARGEGMRRKVRAIRSNNLLREAAEERELCAALEAAERARLAAACLPASLREAPPRAWAATDEGAFCYDAHVILLLESAEASKRLLFEQQQARFLASIVSLHEDGLRVSLFPDIQR
ncbi:hypothetical protein DIPPA_33195 [Diplonema papillatum]|nr:hypothetical protein DIPPA_33195 [Diplonema papillatum]